MTCNMLLKQECFRVDDFKLILNALYTSAFVGVWYWVNPQDAQCNDKSSIVLNLDKMNTMKFVTKNSAHSMVHIGYEEKCIEKMTIQYFLVYQLLTT